MDLISRTSYLHEIVSAQHGGKMIGIPSVCSSHPFVIEACIRRAMQHHTPALVESTCNQVNQYGGYTGMTPQQFHNYLAGVVDKTGFPAARLILGGDHLGPSVWQSEATPGAMKKSAVLVREHVKAGYRKIHLDASMKCADDEDTLPLPVGVAAARAAKLAWHAEAAYEASGHPGDPPVYVIGTEVPVPGGAQEAGETLSVTSPKDLDETIAMTKKAFLALRLGAAWERVIAVVAQPGVEFGDSEVHVYDSEEARRLTESIQSHPNLVFEGHSTDYQPISALSRLVADHFAILKVGPALTFAFREAIFALENIEKELEKVIRLPLSGIGQALEDAMLSRPSDWARYYHGTAEEQAFARKFSLSDRVRYYWTAPKVRAALKLLLGNLSTSPIPITLLSQFFPLEVEDVRNGKVENSPEALIFRHIQEVFDKYQSACFGIPPQ